MGNNWPGLTVPVNGSGNPPDVAVLESLIGFSNFPQQNFVLNGNLEIWNAGASSAPDNWTLNGAGAAVARAASTKWGSYCAQITSGGSDDYLSQNYTAYADMKGKRAKAWCFVKTSTASIAKLVISDGMSSAASSFHTGDGTWQLLSVEYVVSNSATRLTLELHVSNTGNASFDGAVLVDFDHAYGLISRWAKMNEDNEGNLYLSTGKINVGGTNPDEAITITGGNLGLDAQQFVRGKNSGGTRKKLVGVNANDAVEVDTDQIGTLVKGSGTVNGAFNYAADTGSANAYAIAPAPAFTAYTGGMLVVFKAANANTGASTINVNSLGGKNLKVYAGGALVTLPANFIVAGGVVVAIYDGTQFVIISSGNSTAADQVNVEQTASPSGASSQAFTGLTAGGIYRATYVLEWSTSTGALWIRFNNDSGNNYQSARQEWNTGGTLGGTGSGSDSKIILPNSTDTINNGDFIVGTFTFSVNPANSHNCHLIGHAAIMNQGPSFQGLIHAGRYTGAANVTEIDFVASAGAFTGSIKLERIS